MQAIINNPYRILGVLAGASNKEITRQANNLKKYIAAGIDPPVDFSFTNLDNFRRTVEDIDDAIERNDTDPEKIENALFWFWKGNDITDEPAFDALKEGNIQAALDIWDKLTTVTEDDGQCFWREITKKNASAYHNFFVASYLTNVNDQNAITAQIFFLESDYWRNFKEAVTDITYSSSKKELQLLFLNTLISEKTVETGKLVKIIEKADFAAKTDFLKGISKTFTEKITAQIDVSEKKRRENKAKADATGKNLYRQTQADLKQLKEIFGTQDFSYSNVADKVANEILQCSIDYFNDSQEKERDSDCLEIAKELAKNAQSIAVGSMTKERISENLRTLEEMKDKEITEAIQVLQFIKKAYDDVNSIYNIANFQNRKVVNTEKVNITFKQMLTTEFCRKIENCRNYNLLDKYHVLLSSIIGKSNVFDWLRVHCDKVFNIRYELGKQDLLEKVSQKMQLYPKDKYVKIRRIIELLIISENYHWKIRDDIIKTEMTDSDLTDIAYCEDTNLITEFYKNGIKCGLQMRIEKVFVEKLPDSSPLKALIIDRIEQQKRENEERKERRRLETEEKEKERLEEEKREKRKKTIKTCIWTICILGILGYIIYEGGGEWLLGIAIISGIGLFLAWLRSL
jgi:hypothetical protein